MEPPQGDGNSAGQANRPASNKRLQQTQAQVDEVVGIMKVCLFYDLLLIQSIHN